MSVYRDIIMPYAPKYWESNKPDQVQLDCNSKEYNQVASGVLKALTRPRTIKKIMRIQNMHDLGQCLIREQLLLTANPNTPYYRVSRFIRIQQDYLNQALRYNLDHRRCGLTELAFVSNLNQVHANEVVLVVQVVTNTPYSEVIRPSNNLEYFIDYVVTL